MSQFSILHNKTNKNNRATQLLLYNKIHDPMTHKMRIMYDENHNKIRIQML